MFLFVNCCVVVLEDVCLSHCVSTESSTIRECGDHRVRYDAQKNLPE